jgi:hypothetical protein
LLKYEWYEALTRKYKFCCVVKIYMYIVGHGWEKSFLLFQCIVSIKQNIKITIMYILQQKIKVKTYLYLGLIEEKKTI